MLQPSAWSRSRKPAVTQPVPVPRRLTFHRRPVMPTSLFFFFNDTATTEIYTNDNARDAGPYRNLIIANRNGATVRLGDVARVLDMQDGATENIRTYGLYNGKPAVFVTVFQQPGT